MDISEGDLAEPIATGRSAVVHRWPGEDGLVVKLFPAGYPVEEVRAEEHAVQEAVEQGLTPVGSRGVVDVSGRPGLLLEAVDGISLTTRSERSPHQLFACARLLAQLHVGMHARSTSAFRDVRSVAEELLTTEPLAFLTDDEREEVRRRIEALPAGDQVLHMDFHPENVFEHQGGHAVIDWQTAMCGHPAADVAATVLLVRDAELWPGTPLARRVAVGLTRRLVLRAYLREYRRLAPMPQVEVDRWRVVALVLRIGLLDVPGERKRFRSELQAMVR